MWAKQKEHCSGMNLEQISQVCGRSFQIWSNTSVSDPSIFNRSDFFLPIIFIGVLLRGLHSFLTRGESEKARSFFQPLWGFGKFVSYSAILFQIRIVLEVFMNLKSTSECERCIKHCTYSNNNANYEKSFSNCWNIKSSNANENYDCSLKESKKTSLWSFCSKFAKIFAFFIHGQLLFLRSNLQAL